MVTSWLVNGRREGALGRLPPLPVRLPLPGEPPGRLPSALPHTSAEQSTLLQAPALHRQGMLHPDTTAELPHVHQQPVAPPAPELWVALQDAGTSCLSTQQARLNPGAMPNLWHVGRLRLLQDADDLSNSLCDSLLCAAQLHEHPACKDLAIPATDHLRSRPQAQIRACMALLHRGRSERRTRLQDARLHPQSPKIPLLGRCASSFWSSAETRGS